MRKRIFATLLALVMALGLTATAWAADSVTGVKYLDENGDEKTSPETYTLVTSETTIWNEGWYVVSGDVTIDSITISSGKNVDLLLKDGAKLAVTGNIQVGGGGTSETKLTIYGQSAGETAGKLICRSAINIDPASNHVRSFMTLNGGAVDVGGGITVGCNSTGSTSLTVNGGTLNVGGGITVKARTMSNSNLTVKGGAVSVTNSGGDAIKVEGRGPSPSEITITDGTVIAKSTKDGCRAINCQGNLELPTAYWWRTVECGNYTKFVDNTTAYAPGNEVYAEITTQANPVNTNARTGGDWQLDSSSHWKVCAACGEKYAEGEHNLDDGICVCGYEEPAAPAHEPIRRQHVTAVEDTTDTADTTVVASPKTFDAGVAVYGAMAVASVLGMGYVGKKRV